MTDAYDLSSLGPEGFENLVNFLALKTLGTGATGFGPGADGGRDGYFEGEAPYPSEAERWKGVWYIQSKFHKPNLSKDPQKWLIQQVSDEISAFEKEQSDRIWPDNWIIATNIDPSGKPETGSFDAIRKLVRHRTGARGKVNLHIWGGRKILDLLSLYPDIANHFRHLLTPGHVLAALYEELVDTRASVEEIVRFFVASQFADQLFTKLDQANSSSDVRPRVQDLFIDLPYRPSSGSQSSGILLDLCRASAQSHRYSARREIPESWGVWGRQLQRARVSLIKGGPGQGKSTIGQYLSQIHRACLLLSDDGPRVSDAIRNSANGVREAAMRDGFWPSSPRIPIQIELKEFAHWYSRQADGDTGTVLRYLAESVAKKISSDVLPKTLKRALGKRSWIAVFDGLDEVPNDFKDVVAQQVLYFLNDLLIEVDADVLALCTSRPQGYAGQFAGLDGPVVELVQLDAETAMRCAVPLLRFERTDEEAQVSIQTLESAIRSPSVRELMTTPLQSHIMAVVVRDGGRPPERRWQLFNSFYFVMKKRESLKNFQNPAIARLLREDRLLRSVHMRLGFILHARAERSEGAQTTLSKQEFRALVRDVVREIVDQDIEETVSAVMEATTERLVLVNTPESGDQVRFDIRQLQEFFAAEFLYAGVGTDELANRIETIGGDAHWREVMHFLLSALIENQRPTDVSAAVQMLRRLNEGEESSSGSSLLQRRMARALLLAVRLLAEGVLEQDTRDRQQIRPLLEPIGGFQDLRALRNVAFLRPDRSRQWLLALLIEKLSTANPREYLGALALLGWMLPEAHAQASSVEIALFNCTVPFQEILFEQWSPVFDLEYYQSRFYRREAQESPMPWVLRSAVKVLNSTTWTRYSPKAIENLLKICVDQIDLLRDAISTQGLSGVAADAVRKCLSMYEADVQSESKQKKSKLVNCGLVDAVIFPENWMNQRIPSPLRKIDALGASRELHGAFRAMVLCVLFARERSTEALNEFVEIACAAGPDRVRHLPNALLALVPIPNRFAHNAFQVDHLRDASGKQVAALLTELKSKVEPPYASLRLAARAKPESDEQWKAVAIKFPAIAISLAFDPEELPWKRETKFVPELKSAIELNPAVSLRHILKWGLLPAEQRSLLERLKCDAVRLAVRKTEYWGVLGRIVPFKLDLPADVGLLRALGPALTSAARRAKEREVKQLAHGQKDVSLRATILEYGLDLGDLRAVAESGDYDPDTRAGGLALFWLVLTEMPAQQQDPAADRISVQREEQLYRQLVNPDNEGWLTYALVRGVLLSRPESDPSTRALVTHLLERTFDAPGPRQELIELFGAWRERSDAPVHARKVIEKWLGYAYSPPTYMR